VISGQGKWNGKGHRHTSGAVCRSQAQKAIPCWTPWWHLPAASDLRLTVQGTIPVQPLSQGDILYRADPGVTDSQATAPSAHPDMVAGSSPIKTAGEAHIHRDTTASCSSGQPSGMPSPPEAPVPPLRLAGGRDASPLVRYAHPCNPLGRVRASSSLGDILPVKSAVCQGGFGQWSVVPALITRNPAVWWQLCLSE
jgi:hypothetical protein